MPGFLVRLLVNILGLWLATEIVSGMEIRGWGTFVAAALLLGFVNAIVRPIAILLTLPVTLVTMGLFLLVINAAMLKLVAALLGDFTLTGFSAAFFGSLIVSITSWASSWYIGPDGSIEVLVVDGRRRD